MPLYEYQCESCGHRFEVIQRFSDPPVDVCPVCGCPVRKLVSSPAIQFKGTGWYITDYGRKQLPETSAAPSESKSGADKEGGAKSADKEAGAAKGSSVPASDSSSGSSTAKPASPATPSTKDS